MSRARESEVGVVRRTEIAMCAAASFGYPYTPVEIAGKAIERAPISPASLRHDE
jgi:hypothetical protein